MARHFIQNFDYEVNPIFNVHTERAFTSSDNIAIYEHIKHIDNWIEIYLTDKKFVSRTIIESRIAQEVNHIRKITHARSTPDTLLRKALDVCLDESQKYVIRFLDLKDYPTSVTFQEGQSKFDESKYFHMVENGYCEYQLPDTEAFRNFCQKQLEEARVTYEGRDDWRGATWEGFQQSEGYSIVKNFILDQHILDLVSAYKGKEMSLNYISWDYNHHRQTWFKNVNGVERRSPTNYYHFDAHPHGAKMLVYLTDVKIGDGPFRIVKGSNCMSRSTFTIGLHSAIDRHVNPMIPAPPGHFRRAAFTYDRSLLMKLPHAFLGSTHFGDDLVEDSVLTKYLLDNTVVFTRKAGSVIVFDGYLGVHAGGNPLDGERLAIQAGFIQEKPATPKKKQRTLMQRGKSFLKRKLKV
ncbi:MAG: hypothetical protein ACR2IL_10240 [Chitinophagaceae bacterium]